MGRFSRSVILWDVYFNRSLNHVKVEDILYDERGLVCAGVEMFVKFSRMLITPRSTALCDLHDLCVLAGVTRFVTRKLI